MSAPLRLVGSAPGLPFCGMIGEHPAMLRLFDAIARAARLDVPALLEGETGTGKELVAQALHTEGRRHGAFVAVNVATLTEALADAELFGAVKGSYTGATSDRAGLLQAAANGTLLLDEVGDISPPLQAKLLRALESGVVRRVGDPTDCPVRFRLVVSVQESPADLVASGRWRPDFYFRVAGIALRVPPLRDRPTDIPLLTTHFLAGLGHPALGEIGLGALAAYPWPGNVRQLRRAVEQAAFDAGEDAVTAKDVLDRAAAMAAPTYEGATLRAAQARYVNEVLRTSDFDTRLAADRLGLSRSQLYRKIRALGISLPRAR